MRLHTDVPSSLTDFIDAALVRLRLQFGNVEFHRTTAAITADADDPIEVEKLRSAVLHALYREKIYAETLPLRHALLERVLR